MTRGTDKVRAESVTVTLGGRPALRGATMTLARGRVTGLLGPNGSGKTTLLRTLFRGVRAEAGAIWLDGRPHSAYDARSLARHLAVVLQEATHPPGVTVAETIETGRYPHRGDLGRLGARDRAAIDEAATATDLADLLDRELGELSGGQRQRVHLARALAQQAPVLLLDEPTNHLDIRHQFDLMATLRDLAATGVTVALATHDLTLAARYCDAVAVLDSGLVAAHGEVADVFTGPVISEVFGVEARYVAGRLELDPLPRRARATATATKVAQNR